MAAAHSYLASPERRRQARDKVAKTIEQSGVEVVVAHSLGSIVTYEALHPYPDLGVEAWSRSIPRSECQEPSSTCWIRHPTRPATGRAPNLRQWVNIGETGDLVALPRWPGDRFPIDSRHEAHMSAVDLHTLDTHLGSGLTASALTPHCGTP